MVSMNDIIIHMTSAGPNVFKSNIADAVYTLSNNIGNFRYKFFISVDKEDTANFIKDLFNHKSLPMLKDKLLEIKISKNSWASNFNAFFEKYKTLTKYFIICHDDIVVNTPNFFETTIKEIGDRKDIGWITFTNDRYYKINNMAISNSVREGFHIDRDKHPRMFECHKFNESQTPTIELFDLPDRAVKCHGPFSHFNIISSEALKKIGPCEDWTDYTILIDEDWSLESLKKGFYNVWVPQVFYTHPNPKNTHKRVSDLRYSDIAHEKFYKKWDFSCGNYDESVVQFVQQKYADTNIPWSSYRKSYEWDYLNEHS